jgi:hypothetical protein
MGEYRVMHIGESYQIQEKEGKDWVMVGEFDDVNAAKRMVRDLRGGKIETA